MPGGAVRADHAPHPVPVPPVHVRGDDRRDRDLRPGRAPAAPVAADRRLQRLPGVQERLHRAGRPEFLGARMNRPAVNSDTDFDVSKPLKGTAGWLDDRFGGARGVRTYLLRKVYPDHWTFLLGEIALYSFIILLLTGTFLSFFFVPSTTEVVYHGSYVQLHRIKISEAFPSTLRISLRVPGG